MDISKELKQKVKEAIAAVVDAIASTAQKYFFERFSEKEFDSIFDPLETTGSTHEALAHERSTVLHLTHITTNCLTCFIVHFPHIYLLSTNAKIEFLSTL